MEDSYSKDRNYARFTPGSICATLRTSAAPADRNQKTMDYEKLFRLDERVAVVIGAGSGIGQAAARGLAAHGASVVCADARLEAAQATASELNRASAALVDVTQAESVRQLFQAVM